MAFELDSAKPVEAAPSGGGFDISSAKAVEPPVAKRRRSMNRDAENAEAAGRAAVGLGETVLEAGSGAVSSVVGGLSGLGRAAYRYIKGDSGEEALSKGADTSRAIQEAGTYQPRTEAGKDVSHLVNLPIEVANKLLGKAGNAVGSVIGPKTAAAGETIGENIVPFAMAAEGGRRALAPTEPKPMIAGQDYSPLREMTPEQLDRFHRMKGQGVEPTFGNVTRDPAQVRFEQQTAGLESGRAMHQRTIEQDAGLNKGVEGMKSRGDLKGSTDINKADTGRNVRTAVEAKKAAADKEVDKLYNKARASGETKELIDLDPMRKFLETLEAESIAVPELNAVKAMVDKLANKGEKEGNPGMASIDDLENIRQRVNRLGQKDGSVSKFMGDIRNGIDEMTEGKGGDLYKEARAKRKAVGMEFEEQAGVANIIGKKSQTDYKVAGEDVWNKTVIGGSTADLGNVIKTLRTAEEKQKPAAVQALKDTQARAIDHILEEANKTGNFSPAGFKRAFDQIGEEKLTLLLGKDAVQALKDAQQTGRDLKNPPIRMTGSDTSLNKQSIAERLASDHAKTLMKGVLPKFVTRIIDTVTEGSAKRAETRKMASDVDEALTPRRASPASIAEEAAQTKKERKQYVMGEGVKRSALPVAAAYANQDNEIADR
jgi:hypothetical protein